jgi:hypothetical protein
MLQRLYFIANPLSAKISPLSIAVGKSLFPVISYISIACVNGTSFVLLFPQESKKMKTNTKREAGMKIRNLAVLSVALLAVGCGVSINGTGGYDDDDHDVRPSAYVDSWINIPYEVRKVIAPRAEGYYSPKLSRYDDYLYPRDLPYDPYDLPCYVQSDFNGDGYDDFAFLFSYDEWEHGNWYLTTKMVVALSTDYGYTIGADMILGTVMASASVPLEEYWSIYLIPAGRHTFTTYKNNVKIVKTVTLYDDGFYLASLDPEEEAIFYADGYDVFEMSVDGLSKKSALAESAGTDKRMLQFNKNVTGRERAIK